MKTTILDQFGKPFTVAENTLQTAKHEHLPRLFSDHPNIGLTPSKLAHLLIAAEQGDIVQQSELAENMEERDPHLFAELSKRKNAVCSLGFRLITSDNATDAEKEVAAIINDEIFPSLDLYTLIFDLMDALLKAFSCVELEWLYSDSLWKVQTHHRPADWFTVDQNNRDKLLLRNLGMGEELVEGGWIVHKHKSKSGYLARQGLVRVLVWPFLFKNYSLRDLMEFLEVYGLPTGIGKYPANATDKEKNTLLNALVNIGHNARGIIPDGMAIEFLEAAEGNGDPFKIMIEWAENAMSKAILGGTLTSNADGGTKTNALGNVHERALWNLVVSDALKLEATITKELVYRLAVANNPNPSVKIRPGQILFKFNTQDPTDDESLSNTLKKLVDMGLGSNIPVNWVLEQFGIPKPINGESTLSQPVSPPSAAFNRLASLSVQNTTDNWERVLSPKLEAIQNLLNECSDYEEFVKGFSELVTTFENETLTTDLSKKMFKEFLDGYATHQLL